MPRCLERDESPAPLSTAATVHRDEAGNMRGQGQRRHIEALRIAPDNKRNHNQGALSLSETPSPSDVGELTMHGSTSGIMHARDTDAHDHLRSRCES